MSLKLIDLEKSFGRTQVVRSVNLSVKKGEFVVFVGPSGCGKSTLLRAIAGLESISAGRLEIGGRDVTHLPSSQRGIAMVFQSYALYPHLSVYDNIAFSLKIAKLSKAEINQKVREAAETLKLGDYLDRLPKALSGGQRQRVAIGRAIVRQPEVFLFDEPLSNLDAALRNDMRVELAELHSKLGATMIYVTHDQTEAMTLADRIVVLNGGAVEQTGTPMELYLKPCSPFVASFIGSPKMNLFTHRFVDDAGADLGGIRPEDIALQHQETDGDCLTVSARITHVERLGGDTLIHVDAQEFGLLQVRHPDMFQQNVGDTLELILPKHKFHFFRNNVRVGG